MPPPAPPPAVGSSGIRGLTGIRGPQHTALPYTTPPSHVTHPLHKSHTHHHHQTVITCSRSAVLLLFVSRPIPARDQARAAAVTYRDEENLASRIARKRFLTALPAHSPYPRTGRGSRKAPGPAAGPQPARAILRSYRVRNARKMKAEKSPSLPFADQQRATTPKKSSPLPI